MLPSTRSRAERLLEVRGPLRRVGGRSPSTASVRWNQVSASGAASRLDQRVGVGVAQSRHPRLARLREQVRSVSRVRSAASSSPRSRRAPASTMVSSASSAGESFSRGGVADQGERAVRTAERTLAVGHDRDVVLCAVHPLGRTQLGQGLGVLARGVRRLADAPRAPPRAGWPAPARPGCAGRPSSARSRSAGRRPRGGGPRAARACRAATAAAPGWSGRARVPVISSGSGGPS